MSLQKMVDPAALCPCLTLFAGPLHPMPASPAPVWHGGQPVAAFRKVQGGGKIGHLRKRQCQPKGGITARVHLRDGHAIFKRLDDHILLQGNPALIDKGDHGRVEIVFDSKHAAKFRAAGVQAQAEYAGSG